MARDMVQVRRGRTHQYQGPDANVGRSQFNRSHGLKTTFDASWIYPIFIDDVLPGDTMTMSMDGFARIFSPLDAPLMDNITLESFWFFIPNRLSWANWIYFQGEHDAAGAQDTTYTIPVINTGLTVDHTGQDGHALAAWLGLPEGLLSSSVDDLSCLPLRCYERVINEWFRDQNLTDEDAYTTDNGPDAISGYSIKKSNKKHDYFTSALPYLQKGTAQTVALSGSATVVSPAGAGTDITVYSTTSTNHHKLDAGATHVDMSATTQTEATGGLYADLSDTFTGGAAASVDVNALRQAIMIQRSLEIDARGGTRYVETLKSRFGVTSPDFRLQRSEFLGGGKSFINVSPVANTSAVDSTVSVSGSDEYQGELKGVGTGVISGHGFAKSFTEHGYILGLIRARGDLTYFQGVDRHWRRSTRYDFYEPSLAHLGEQSILNSEIFVSNDANDDAVFGYQERWSEYRQMRSKVTGHFNPEVSGALDHWHVAEEFGSLPTLSTSFINDATPMDRIVSIPSVPDFLLDVWFNYKCARPIPVFSVPNIAARF